MHHTINSIKKQALSLSLLDRRSHQRGFTIVELLIVIVVIAILAALSYVGFTNMQDGARLATAQSDFSNTRKSLMLFKAEKGAYPKDASELSSANLRVTKSVYGPVSGYGNLVYCLNTSTDEFAFMGRLLNGSATVHVTSTGDIQTTNQMTSYAIVCGLVGATESDRYVIIGLSGSGTWSSWLAG